MTRNEPRAKEPSDYRARLTLAVISGVLGGAARAVTSWLLDHLTSLLP
jgi:hypothetical protein